MHLMILARLGVVLTLIAHVTALSLGGHDAIETPISQLSRTTFGLVHTMGLVALAGAWVCLALQLRGRTDGWLWLLAWMVLLACVPLLLFVAFYFSTANPGQLAGPDANDPLAALACVIGVAMGAFQPGLKHLAPRLAAINLLVLVLWLGAIPVIPFLADGWIGAYERSLGALLLLWTLMMSFVSDVEVEKRSTK